MRDDITPARIANSIMQNKNFQGVYIIVEGIKDLNCFKKFIDKNYATLQVAFGYEKVKEVLSILKERIDFDYENVIGIIDRDFREITNIHETIENLFITDYHDLEISIIQSNAFENVLNICATEENIRKFENEASSSIKNLIFELSKNIGYLKLSNHVDNLGLVFKPKTLDANTIKYSDFICTKELKLVSVDKMIDTVFNYSIQKSKNLKSKDIIKKSYNKNILNSHNILHLVNGHDFTNIFSLVLKKNLKANSFNDGNEIEKKLILAYEYENFKQTNLFKNISLWLKSNNKNIFKQLNSF